MAFKTNDKGQGHIHGYLCAMMIKLVTNMCFDIVNKIAKQILQDFLKFIFFYFIAKISIFCKQDCQTNKIEN